MRKIYNKILIILITLVLALVNISYTNASTTSKKKSIKEVEEIFNRSYNELIKWLEINSFSLTEKIVKGASKKDIKVIVDKQRDIAVYEQGILVASIVNNMSYLNPQLINKDYGEELEIELSLANELGLNNGVLWYKIEEEDVEELIISESNALDLAGKLNQVFYSLNPNNPKIEEMFYVDSVLKEANGLAAFTIKNDIEEQLRFVAKDLNKGDKYSKGVYKLKSGTEIKLKIKKDFAEIDSVSNSKKEQKYNISWHSKGVNGDGDIIVKNKNSISTLSIKDNMLISFIVKEINSKEKSDSTTEYSLTVEKNTFDVLAPTKGVLEIKEIRKSPVYNKKFDKNASTEILWNSLDTILEDGFSQLAYSGVRNVLTVEDLKNGMDALVMDGLYYSGIYLSNEKGSTPAMVRVVLYDKAFEISSQYGTEKTVACVPIENTFKMKWDSIEEISKNREKLINKYKENSVPTTCSKDISGKVKTVLVSNKNK